MLPFCEFEVSVMLSFSKALGPLPLIILTESTTKGTKASKRNSWRSKFTLNYDNHSGRFFEGVFSSEFLVDRVDLRPGNFLENDFGPPQSE